jgi:hypothetical protein
MTSEIAAMLDELMGRGRNEEAGKQTQRVDYKDPEVCHYYVCGFCPHELFVNTRADLGPCKKIHDEAIRKEYQTSDDVFKLGYEEKFYDFLTDCVVEVERRIKRNKMRLDQTNGGRQEDTPESAEATQRLSQLQIEISNLLLEVESLGEQGEVQQAMAKTAQVEKLKEERERIRQRNSSMIQQPEPQTFNGIQEKQMEVCEICGSFLIVGDAQARVDDHLMGKQHMGYARMRAKIAEFKEVIEKKRDTRRSSRSDARRSEDRNQAERDTGRTDRRDSRTDHGNERTRGERYKSDRQDDRHRSDNRGDQRDHRSYHKERRRSSDRSRSDRHRRHDNDDRRDHRDRDRHHRRRRSRSRSGERRKEERRSSKGESRHHRENGTHR